MVSGEQTQLPAALRTERKRQPDGRLWVWDEIRYEAEKVMLLCCVHPIEAFNMKVKTLYVVVAVIVTSIANHAPISHGIEK